VVGINRPCNKDPVTPFAWSAFKDQVAVVVLEMEFSVGRIFGLCDSPLRHTLGHRGVLNSLLFAGELAITVWKFGEDICRNLTEYGLIVFSFGLVSFDSIIGKRTGEVC